MTFRLAIRHTEDECIAFLAMKGTMDGAIRLGSIARGVTRESKHAFLKLMMQVAEDLEMQRTGARPGWARARPMQHSADATC